jgi:hypothetical protein
MTLQKQYIREVRKELLCPRKVQKKFLEELSGSLYTYLEEHPNATMEDIYARFGSSSELAESYLKTIDPEELKNQVRIARTVRRTLIAVALSIVLLFTIMVVVMIIDNRNSRPSRQVIVLTDEGDISTDTTSDIQVEETS